VTPPINEHNNLDVRKATNIVQFEALGMGGGKSPIFSTVYHPNPTDVCTFITCAHSWQFLMMESEQLPCQTLAIMAAVAAAGENNCPAKSHYFVSQREADEKQKRSR
ncbi:hypothetical protein Dimus_026979, partial [Dionaea muscipula]